VIGTSEKKLGSKQGLKHFFATFANSGTVTWQHRMFLLEMRSLFISTARTSTLTVLIRVSLACHDSTRLRSDMWMHEATNTTVFFCFRASSKRICLSKHLVTCLLVVWCQARQECRKQVPAGLVATPFQRHLSPSTHEQMDGKESKT